MIMRTWWRNLSLNIKLNLPIQVALLVSLSIVNFMVVANYESTMLEGAQVRIRESATQSMLALNSMMLSGTIGNRAARSAFQDKMSLLDGVEDFHLARTSGLKYQYGQGLEAERQGDDLDRLAAETGTVQTEIARNGKHTLRMVVPYKAEKNFFGTNCLRCHRVQEGTVLGTISLKTSLESEYKKIHQLGFALLTNQFFLQIFLFMLICWLIRISTRSVVDLKNVMLQVKENEDFSRRADVRGNDEIGQIAQVFNNFVSHMENLQIRLAEKISALEQYQIQTEEELRLGSDIMARINDAQSTSDPSVRMQINSATQYSGDVILVSRSPTNTLYIMLADAVGHGLIAAMNLLPLSQIFKAMAKKGIPLMRIAEELNSKTHRLMPVDRFIGAVLVSIDFGNRIIEVWNGGLPAPILVGSDGAILNEWESRNLPLGILSEDEFFPEEKIFHYEADCQLFAFSDGLSEARSLEGESFGKERIKQLLQDVNPDRRFDLLMHSLEQHLGGVPAHDDLSLLMVNLSLAKAKKIPMQQFSDSCDIVSSPNNWRVAISLGVEELKYLNVVSMLSQIIDKIHATAEHRSQLYVILSELFNNALDHGILRLHSAMKQGFDGFENYIQLREKRLRSLSTGLIEIEMEKVVIEGHDAVKIHVFDSGNGFEYSAYTGASPENVAQGQHGRGITLVRNIAYKLEYSGKGNEVTVFYLLD